VHALPIRPIEGFVAAWPGMADRMLRRHRRFDLAILGAGAAGIELAFAAHHRALSEGGSHLRIALVGSGPLPLEGGPPSAQQRLGALLAERGIEWHGGRRATAIESGQIRFDRGAPLSFDGCLVVTGAAAPAWPAASGLATDERGFIRVGKSLQSLSHPQVHAAGDVAAYADARPKSGVYAVKAGPVLSYNLRAACEGRAPRYWTPQQKALYLVSTGDRHALALWGPWSVEGNWVWQWKDWIDRRFMRRFGTSA
jgi:selenide,water dikinase